MKHFLEGEKKKINSCELLSSFIMEHVLNKQL